MLIKNLKQIRNTYHNEEGFTLIELMIVVVIIGILAAIAIPIFANQQKAAIEGSVKADVRNLHTALVTYLVKDPASTTLSYSRTATTASGWLASADKLGSVPITGNNQLKIRLATNASIDTGTWDNYAVLGWNNDLTLAEYRVTFSSITGNTVEKRP